MSYNCDLCCAHVPAGQLLRRWNILRPNGQIEKELKVCEECQDDLRAGIDPTILAEEHRRGMTRELPAVLLDGQGAPIKGVMEEAKDNRKMIPKSLPAGKPTKVVKVVKGRKNKDAKVPGKPHPQRNEKG